ncbi:MAG: oligosaccharide flippase family protein, partial [Bacteroidota bacterium]|nr:oligosaccharide flippase family protein [Bacteroidota bacterium]
MREHIARLTSDSAVYGLSTIVGRFLNFLLVPFYTNVFPTDAYGIVTVVYSFVAFLNVLLAGGFDTAFMRFLERRQGEERARVFSTAFWPVAASAASCAFVIIAFRDPIAAGLHIRPEWKAIVPLTAGILFLDALNVVPFA